MYAYMVAFDTTGAFVLVHNKKRNGWEFPGGRIEADESPEDAAVREFKEETGFDVRVVAYRKWDDGGHVFCGMVDYTKRTKLVDDAIDGVGIFTTLPEDIAWSRDEYIMVLNWATMALRASNQEASQ